MACCDGFESEEIIVIFMVDVYEFIENRNGGLYKKIEWRGTLDSVILNLCGLELVGTINNGFSGCVVRRKIYNKTT